MQISVLQTVSLKSDQPFETTIPIYSRLTFRMSGATFHDAWCITLPANNLSAFDLFVQAAQHAPPWIRRCLSLRNRIAKRLGLKPMGSMTALAKCKSIGAEADLQPHRCLFRILDSTFDELLLCGEDKHLNVVFSVHRQPMADGQAVALTISSVVHAHSRLGRMYMRTIHPIHRRLVPAMLRVMAQGHGAAALTSKHPA